MKIYFDVQLTDRSYFKNLSAGQKNIHDKTIAWVAEKLEALKDEIEAEEFYHPGTGIYILKETMQIFPEGYSSELTGKINACLETSHFNSFLQSLT